MPNAKPRPYEGRRKVVSTDRCCFPVDPTTLHPLGCGQYEVDPYQSDDGSVEIISISEWWQRCDRIEARRLRDAGAPFTVWGGRT
jgi:hypothetical protein